MNAAARAALTIAHPVVDLAAPLSDEALAALAIPARRAYLLAFDRATHAAAVARPRSLYDLPIFEWAWKEDARTLRA